jgi:predicted membrane channel-forming protein YqfA (hemolysin III family)
MDAVASPAPKEELANALTHALGLALALAGLAVLVTLASFRGSPRQS